VIYSEFPSREDVEWGPRRVVHGGPCFPYRPAHPTAAASPFTGLSIGPVLPPVHGLPLHRHRRRPTCSAGGHPAHPLVRPGAPRPASDGSSGRDHYCHRDTAGRRRSHRYASAGAGGHTARGLDPRADDNRRGGWPPLLESPSTGDHGPVAGGRDMVAAQGLARVTLCRYHHITSLICTLRTMRYQHLVD